MLRILKLCKNVEEYDIVRKMLRNLFESKMSEDYDIVNKCCGLYYCVKMLMIMIFCKIGENN